MAICEPLLNDGPRRRYRLRSPATLEEIGVLECMNDVDVASAVERARKAQPGWAAASVDERATIVRRACDLVLQQQDRIVETVIRETGKTETEAFSMEIYASCDAMTHYAKYAKKFLKPQKTRIHGVLGFVKQLRISYRPLGVVGIIVPWNAPFVLAMNQAVQALMAGNAVLLKGSEVTPYSSAEVGSIFEAAGLPDGVLQVLFGDGGTGAALVEAGVDKISFTGSESTGRKVGEACGRQLIPVTLELGGKDAMIVCADADLERAAAGAVFGSCMNAGQFCCGTERIYVVESVYDAFVEKVLAKAKALRQKQCGDGDIGAICWDRQIETIERHVADAVARGANVHLGGRRHPDFPGLFYEPTVITEVTHEMDIMVHETFGPVIALMRVADEEEAIERANDSEYGLQGNVWTQNTAKGVAMAQRLETGGVCVNDIALTYGVPEAPFGGMKSSGLGQVNGRVGIRGYCHAQPVVIDRFGGKEIQGGYPYTSRKLALMKRLAKFLFGSPVGRWLR